jgi:hypothetical protein
MKRIVLILGVTVLACLLACASVFYSRTRQPPAEWMGRQLGLEGAALAEFTAAHNEYAESCSEMCRRIASVNDELAEEVVSSEELTPKIVELTSKAESLRAECKQNMLHHFYDVAKLLDQEKQAEYLQLVLPLITEQSHMQQLHHH